MRVLRITLGGSAMSGRSAGPGLRGDLGADWEPVPTRVRRRRRGASAEHVVTRVVPDGVEGCTPSARTGRAPDLPAARDARREGRKAKPPTCQHGEWRFAGSDPRARCREVALPNRRMYPSEPVDQGGPPPPLIPRETPGWRKLYKGRASVEREFGRLKNEWAMLLLRVRGLERVQLHADLTILAKLACALSRARVVPLAA